MISLVFLISGIVVSLFFLNLNMIETAPVILFLASVITLGFIKLGEIIDDDNDRIKYRW